MAKSSPHQTHFTRQVQVLLSKIYGRSKLNDSVLERAISYFEDSAVFGEGNKQEEVQAAARNLEQIERSNHLLSICHEIIELIEGGDFDESNRKSARLLGTIQLITPTEGNNIASYNERCKSLYKAVLSVRLVDRLILDSSLTDKHVTRITDEYEGVAFSDYNYDERQRFNEQVKIPLLMAALLQDIGNYHPQAQAILRGENNDLDPQRTLEPEQRSKLLQLNYKHTLNYISEGLGVVSYRGNSKEERAQFIVDERAKRQFVQQLLKASIKPKNGIGNLLKVPQIYTSIILSTKDNYNYKVLPQVYLVLNKSAELGACCQNVVDGLYQITGMFPQGYGIIYMPVDAQGYQVDCYEYAIVNRLYPSVPEQPLCRTTTRKLTFIGYGHSIEVKKKNNLYFPNMAKKISSLSKDRLNEILSLLSSNHQERQSLDLLPRCWHPNEYFSTKEHQKLWNREEK